MQKKYIFILSILIMSIKISGQNITATILDKETNSTLEFADVYFPDLHTGTLTNNKGEFKVPNINKSGLHAIISIVGYETLSVLITESKNQVFYLQTSHITLKDVVISVPNGKLQGENIVNIQSNKIVQLKTYAPITLAEALTNVPGVEQISTGGGIGKPVIRGLSSSRIVTYTQGIRLENQQWGAEHGLGIGDIGIKSVEVIKGPASLLYGADALGGVLYFVDDDYANNNSTEGYLESKFQSNNLNFSNNIGLKLNKNNFKVNVFGAYNTSADYSISGGEKVFNTRFDEQNFKTSIGYVKGNWVTNIRYSYLKNNFGITEDDNPPLYTGSNNREMELPYQTIVNHNISFENKIFIGESKIGLTLGYTSNNRKEFEEHIDEAGLNMILQTSQYNLKWNSKKYNEKLSFVLGSQGLYQTNTNKGEEVLIPDAATKDIGVYGMANYLLIDNLNLQAGLRVDNRNIDSKEMSFHDHDGNHHTIEKLNKSFIGFNYSLGASYVRDKSTFRANFSTGFRAPNTTELLADGEHEGSGQYLKGNKDLVSENAQQLDIEYSFTNDHLNFFVNPFVNKINNYIYLDPSNNSIGGVRVYNYKQTDAVLYGGEMGFHYHPHSIHWLHISSDISTVFAEDDNGNNLPFIPATKFNSTVKAEFNQNSLFRINNVYIQNIYKLDQNRVGIFETETPSYSLFNAGAEFELANNKLPILITTGVKNIFDVRYTDHLSRLKPMAIPNQGVNFYIGLKLNLGSNI